MAYAYLLPPTVRKPVGIGVKGTPPRSLWFGALVTDVEEDGDHHAGWNMQGLSPYRNAPDPLFGIKERPILATVKRRE